jgi:hypothetical protein
MTNAIKQHNLSKLDLFTPNCLHPTLPPLAHGEYSVMGGIATSTFDTCEFTRKLTNHSVIYEPDLIARQRYLVSLLGSLEGPESIGAQKRIRRHDQLMAHMEIAYSTARKVWFRNPQTQKEGKTLKKSLATKESREEYVRNALKTEWATLSTKGSCES